MQGALLGTLMSMHHERTGPLLIVNVQQDTDGQGCYLPYFDVTLFSGTVIRIATTVQPSVASSVTDQAERDQERSDTIRDRLRSDLLKTLRLNLVDVTDNLMDDLLQDAMHQVDQLITEER